MKKVFLIVIAIVICGLTVGCTGNKVKDSSRSDVEFTVVPRDDIPDELMKFIEEKKKEDFSMSYGIGESLYIVKGYGTVPTGGYSIVVDSVSETRDEIFFRSTLKGPEASEPVNKMQTYPYIVVKIEFTDKKIVFE